MTTTPLRAVIVDDEPLAREGIELVLRDVGAPVEIVGSSGGGAHALALIRDTRPDLLFLDVQMPELDGFALLELLSPEDEPPAIIFVTAHDQHAIRAFDARALDYVLKPVVAARLVAAVERARRRVAEVRAMELAESAAVDPVIDVPLLHLVVKEGDTTSMVSIADIHWIQADAYNVWLHTLQRSYLLRTRMHVLERALPARDFIRVHRSAIVRISCVREIVTRSRYEHTIILDSGAQVPMASGRRATLVELRPGFPGP